MAKIIESGWFLGTTLSNLGRIILLGIAVPLAKDVLPKLATKAIASAVDQLEKK